MLLTSKSSDEQEADGSREDFQIEIEGISKNSSQSVQ